MTIARSARRPSGLALRLLLLAVVAAPPGCGGGGGLSPVSGQVIYEGKPACGALVYFHPRDGAGAIATGSTSALPMGKVGADGKFELRTDSRGKGAPPGWYVVTVVWKSPSAAGDGDEENLLPRRYMVPATSGLVVEVKEGPNELAPFLLTRSPGALMTRPPQ